MATEEQDLSFYTTQSRFTDPGPMGAWLGDLPTTVAGLHRLAKGLVVHYRADDPIGKGISPERLAEVDTRYVGDMLARLAEMDGRPLGPAREPTACLVGCCRDFTVLFVAMARAVGIPARARVGFATYFVPGYNLDHVVAEIWDSAAGRWRLVDPECGDNHSDQAGSPVDPLDLGLSQFLVAGTAWQRCRAGKADAGTFLVDPGLGVPQTRGWPYLAHNLVHDLAALNKMEMLLWDSWGLVEQEGLRPEDLELLDRVAALTSSPATEVPELQAIYGAEPRLRVPGTLTSYDPLGGPPRKVSLRSDMVAIAGQTRRP